MNERTQNRTDVQITEGIINCERYTWKHGSYSQRRPQKEDRARDACRYQWCCWKQRSLVWLFATLWHPKTLHQQERGVNLPVLTSTSPLAHTQQKLSCCHSLTTSTEQEELKSKSAVLSKGTSYPKGFCWCSYDYVSDYCPIDTDLQERSVTWA